MHFVKFKIIGEKKGFFFFLINKASHSVYLVFIYCLVLDKIFFYK